MIRDVANLISLVSHYLTFLSCIMVFIGGGYVALHSRTIPRWAATGLWYIGLAAFLNAITIAIGWIFGQTHPLSHFQIGIATETLFNLTIASMVGLMFFNTIWKDFQGAKTRSVAQERPIKKTISKPVKTTPVKKVTSTKTTRIRKSGTL